MEARWRRACARHVPVRHVLFCLCDHYEPLWGGVDEARGQARVDAWVEGYPAMAAAHRDVNGRAPRHSFFFPGDEYRPAFMEGLASLARQGLGEIEVHLHHDGDTRTSLRETFRRHLAAFVDHGALPVVAGQPRWAFIHGNWSLANSRPDRKWCGVDDELTLLHELGCYADFTFPSAPDPCQPPMVNAIYWPYGDLTKARAADHGVHARVGVRYDDRLLLITGPLAIARKGARSLRIENGALTGRDPATPQRVATWLDQAICVTGREEWVFVKVHTHGAIEATADSLLGSGGHALHTALRQACLARGWELHYVAAREMFNVAVAAMEGRSGAPSQWFDYLIPPAPIVSGG